MSAEPKVSHAIRMVNASIDPNARDQYVEQVKAFARAFGFTLTFSRTSPYPNDIVAHLERHDTRMVGVMASGFEAADLAYRFAFYVHPNRPISPASLDPVVEGLMHFLGRIEGAVVMEKQPQS